jgi:glycosyltransferase involved in cell wall biosynthesis
MYIAIDAHMVGERETGNETYAVSLIQALLRLTARDPKGFSWDPAGPANATQALPSTQRDQQRRFGDSPRFDLLATHPERLRAALAPRLPGTADELPTHASIRRVRPANALVRIPLGMPLQALRQGYDLLHVTYNAPPLCPCPTIVTIHDISFEHYPQFFSPRDRLILQTLVPLSARRARRIITVSQHAKQEIMARYQIPGGKIAVTYEAAGERFVPIADPAALRAVRATYSIPDGPFVLALGNLQPRKNIRRLVEAFAGAVEGEGWRVAGGELRQGSTDYSNSPPSTLHPSLVIAGKAKWRESEIFQAVQEAGLAHAVVFPGYVDDDDLPALYSAAAVFVYPSLYEGFGLPPLEAMACGTPVICSKAASLPEVTGDAALSVDPADVDSLAQALCDVLATPGLRADLRQRGLRRAAQFSWSRCATETLAVYREALQTEARER